MYLTENWIQIFLHIIWWSHCISLSKTWDYGLKIICNTITEMKITRNEKDIKWANIVFPTFYLIFVTSQTLKNTTKNKSVHIFLIRYWLFKNKGQSAFQMKSQLLIQTTK